MTACVMRAPPIGDSWHIMQSMGTELAMKAKYWYVSEAEGQWTLSEEWGTGEQLVGDSYQEEAAALQRARSRAEQHHNRHGVPTGVRVRGPDHRWREEFSYGHL